MCRTTHVEIHLFTSSNLLGRYSWCAEEKIESLRQIGTTTTGTFEELPISLVLDIKLWVNYIPTGQALASSIYLASSSGRRGRVRPLIVDTLLLAAKTNVLIFVCHEAERKCYCFKASFLQFHTFYHRDERKLSQSLFFFFKECSSPIPFVMFAFLKRVQCERQGRWGDSKGSGPVSNPCQLRHIRVPLDHTENMQF